MTNKLNDVGYSLIRGFEGFVPHPYYATAEERSHNIVTIGYGNTYYENKQPVKITDPAISPERGILLHKMIADEVAAKVAAMLTKPVNQNQFNALVSIAFNIGTPALSHSTLLRLVNANPNDPKISDAFLMWNKQAGVELAGLTKRRKIEAALYFKAA